MEKVKGEIENAEKEREELWNMLSDRIKRLYEKLVATKGSAVARATNYTCQGCFTGIPPQLFLEIKKGERIMQCPFCGRILYYWEESSSDEG